MSTATQHHQAQSNGEWALWFAVLGPPLAWTVQLLVGYYLSSLNCKSQFSGFQLLGVSGFKVLIVVLSLVAALVTVAAGLTGWRRWRDTGAVESRTDEGLSGRVAFMALGGALLSMLFLLLIILSAIPSMVLSHACHTI
jgi:hypothetical protein